MFVVLSSSLFVKPRTKNQEQRWNRNCGKAAPNQNTNKTLSTMKDMEAPKIVAKKYIELYEEILAYESDDQRTEGRSQWFGDAVSG
jgi:hypothetical protein